MSDNMTPRDRALAGEVMKLSDETLRELRRYTMSKVWHGVIDELLAARREIERLGKDIAHRDELENFSAPLSCPTHGLVPNLASFDNKCPECKCDQLKRERDEWAEKWHRIRLEYAELKYPGMKGVIRPTEAPQADTVTNNALHIEQLKNRVAELEAGHREVTRENANHLAELQYIERVLLKMRNQCGADARESADDTLQWLRNRLLVAKAPVAAHSPSTGATP